MTTMEQSVSVLLIGNCGAGKSTLLHRLEKEQLQSQIAGKMNQQLLDNEDSDVDEEEALDKFEQNLTFYQCQYNNMKTSFIEFKFQIEMLQQASCYDVLAIVFNCQKGIFESEIDGVNFDYLQIIKGLKDMKIIFIITNMGYCNWDFQRFDFIRSSIHKLIVDKYQLGDFTIIPIDSVTGFNISQAVQNQICSWYEGLTLLQQLEQYVFEKQECFRIKILDVAYILPKMNDNYHSLDLKGYDCNYYLCKVISGQVKDICFPYSLSMSLGKKPLTILQIYNYTSYPINHVQQNDLIYIEVQTHEVQKGDILQNFHEPQCYVVQEFLAEIELFQLHQSILTLGFLGNLYFVGQKVPFQILNVEYVLDSQQKKSKKGYLKSMEVGGVKIQTNTPICVDKYENFQKMGSFLILAENQQIIGIGKVLKVKPI